jgi:hypothetical protein
MLKKFIIATAAVAFVAGSISTAHAGWGNGRELNGVSLNGGGENGIIKNGGFGNGITRNTLSSNGGGTNGGGNNGVASGMSHFAIDGIELPATR